MMTHSAIDDEMAVTIRPCRDTDRDTLVQITISCFNGVSIDQNIEKLFGVIADCNWQKRKARHILEDIEINPDGVFVAEVSGRTAGYVSSRIDTHTRIGWIANLAVLTDYRRMGIGRQLIQTALDYFKRQGMAAAKIETLDQNPIGKHLYPKMGFQPVAQQIHYLKLLDDHQRRAK